MRAIFSDYFLPLKRRLTLAFWGQQPFRADGITHLQQDKETWVTESKTPRGSHPGENLESRLVQGELASQRPHSAPTSCRWRPPVLSWLMFRSLVSTAQSYLPVVPSCFSGDDIPRVSEGLWAFPPYDRNSQVA